MINRIYNDEYNSMLCIDLNEDETISDISHKLKEVFTDYTQHLLRTGKGELILDDNIDISIEPYRCTIKYKKNYAIELCGKVEIINYPITVFVYCNKSKNIMMIPIDAVNRCNAYQINSIFDAVLNKHSGLIRNREKKFDLDDDDTFLAGQNSFFTMPFRYEKENEFYDIKYTDEIILTFEMKSISPKGRG